MGRAVSHPRAIDVAVENGVVALRGPILAHEVGNLLGTVRGVQDVRNDMTVHESAGNVPELQG